MFWAWMLSERMRHPRFAGVSASLALFALTAGALVTQPDIGQTVLLLIVMTMMFALAGVDWRWLAGIGAAGAGGFAALYSFFPHVRARVDAFLFTEPDSGTQVGRALDAIASGGLFGRGPGEGVIKRHLPDAHADFVYAVGAEEFGLIVSIGIVAIFGALAFRGLSRAARLNEAFEQLAATGLIALLVTQAAIHVAVNLSLLPAKGMTLPFISFGGSSMMGSALAMGACVSLLRNRPGAFLFGRSP
jgi:cell division protein FtsW